MSWRSWTSTGCWPVDKGGAIQIQITKAEDGYVISAAFVGSIPLLYIAPTFELMCDRLAQLFEPREPIHPLWHETLAGALAMFGHPDDCGCDECVEDDEEPPPYMNWLLY